MQVCDEGLRMIAQSRPQDPDDLPGTQLIRRVGLLLRVLTRKNRAGTRLIDLCRETALERPTIHRILHGLIAEGLVTQDHHSRKYYLGKSVYEMGLAAAPRLQLRDICHPLLKLLAEETGDTAYLCEREGFDGVCVDRQDGGFPINAFALEPGHRRPLSAGCGNLAILSALPDEQVRRICAVNRPRVQARHPHLTDDELRSRIERTRRDGFAHVDALETPGKVSIGMCIRDADGVPIAALSVSAVTGRLQDRRLTAAIALLRDTTRECEARLRLATLRSREGAPSTPRRHTRPAR